MNNLLTGLEVPEVPVKVEFDNESLFNLGLTLVITAIIIIVVFRYVNK